MRADAHAQLASACRRVHKLLALCGRRLRAAHDRTEMRADAHAQLVSACRRVYKLLALCGRRLAAAYDRTETRADAHAQFVSTCRRVHELLALCGRRLAAAHDKAEMQAVACDTTLALLGSDPHAGAAVMRASGQGFIAVTTVGDLSTPATLTIIPGGLSESALEALTNGEAITVADGPAVLGVRRSDRRDDRLVLAPILVLGRLCYLLVASGSTAEQIRHPLAVLASMVSLAQHSHEQGWAEAVIADAQDIVLLLEPDGTIRTANAAVRRVLGQDPESLAGTPVAGLVHPDDAEPLMLWLADAGVLPFPLPSLELRCRPKSGDSWVDVEAVANAIHDGPEIRGVVLSLRDVRERNTLTAELTHRVTHDPLTNLANRAQLCDRIAQALAKSTRTGVAPAVLYIDLDDFKAVNDSLGHQAGDRVLLIVAERLRRCLRPGDTLARLGGDEFVALIEDNAVAESLADRLLATLRDVIALGVADIQTHASIGIRTADADSDVDQLLRDADLAMSAVKASGKGGWKRFQPDMYEQVQQQLRIRSDLRQALDPNEFLLNYQPIVEVDTGHIVGFEALIRWQHRRRGLIGPNEFIADAEHTNLIIPIGAWVLKTACAAASAMRAVVDDLTMSVNVSPRQLRSDDIIDVVRAALKEAGLPPAALCLEITESVLAEDPSIIERLKTLRALGVHLAIDDFGTGFSSYGHLQRLPIDTIKIDRSFIERLGPDQPAPAVAYGIVQMSLAMGLRTVAEGVETPEQRTALQDLGCPFAQGFLFSRPVDEANALALLADRS